MPPKIKTSWKQADFFYDLNWDEKIDSHFIDYLSFEARIGKFVWPFKKIVATIHAIESVNYMHNKEFTYQYGLDKLELLEKRYNTFSWMLRLEHVTYGTATNVVAAPNEVWSHILEEEPFAWAYVVEGDAKFKELTVMFAPPVDDTVMLSSDEDGVNHTNDMSGKEFILVDDEMPQQPLNDMPPNWTDQTPENVDPYAIVPYVQPVPLQSVPPLNLVSISSDTSKSSLFNWWDYLEAMSDDTSSTATDTSTARSVNFMVSTPKVVRPRPTHHKNRASTSKQAVYLSSTASNSPLKKESKKWSKTWMLLCLILYNYRLRL